MKMITGKLVIYAICLLVMTMGILVHADVITLTDAAQTDDATNLGRTGFTTRNVGLTTLMQIGHPYPDADQVSLIRWDTSGLSNVTINSATVKIYFRDAGYGTGMVDVHKIMPANAGWIEGVGNGNPSNPGECSWDYKNYDTDPAT